ncbi:MAG: flippase [Acidimicrobiia bacterium]|nr:flippase [Acidimicrobiia bacterium]
MTGVATPPPPPDDEVDGVDEAEESEREILGIARGGALNIGGQLCSQTSFFLITLVLARTLGQADVGVYAQGFAFLTLLGLLSLSGFRAGLTRFVAVHLAERQWGAVRGTVRLGLGLSAAGSAVLGVALFALSSTLANGVFGDHNVGVALRFVAATLPASVFIDAALSATQGFKTMKPYATVGLILEPGLRLALTGGALAMGWGLRGALVALVASNYVGAVLAAIALWRLMRIPHEAPRYDIRELFVFSVVSWMASLASAGLIWADTILLGAYKTSSDVGLYQVATRMVMLAAFVMTPVNAAFAPRIADLYQRHRMKSLRDTYVAATSWILRLSLPAFVLCVVMPKELLSLFGHRFDVEAAVTVVIVLSIGKLVDSATGPCGLMLNMSGRPGYSLFDNVLVLVANVALNIWLIPHHGIVGSAYAWAISLALVNVLRVVQVKQVLGMVPFGIGEAKALVAAIAAGVVTYAIGEWRGVVEVGTLLLGGVALCVTYVAVVAALGITSDDRLILDALRGRRRLATS